MAKKLNFAIIGCGRIASRHAEHIKTFGNLVAVCDIDNTAGRTFADYWQVPFYQQLEDMLTTERAIDIVVVCTPNGLHASHSIQSLKAGKHVLCEKPMAITTHDCEEMINSARENKRHLFVVKQNRYNPPVIAVKKALDENKLGRVSSIQVNCFWNRDAEYYANSWKGSAKLDGGTLFTQFSHFIDLTYWMFGDVSQVVAATENHDHQGVIDFEDNGVVILKFDNNMLGSIHFTVNAFKKNMEGSLTIFGEKGTVKIGGQYLNELEYQCVDNYVFEALPAGNPPNRYGNYEGSMSNHGKVYENVLAVIDENKPVNTTVFEALKTVEIIERIYKAASSFNSKS